MFIIIVGYYVVCFYLVAKIHINNEVSSIKSDYSLYFLIKTAY